MRTSNCGASELLLQEAIEGWLDVVSQYREVAGKRFTDVHVSLVQP